MEQGLRELAERVGILASYRAVDGRTQRATSDATRRALLRDMGIDVSRPAAVMAALDRAEQQRLLPATGLVRPGEPSRVRLRRSLRHGLARVQLEDGDAVEWPLGRSRTIELPALPPGVHELRVASGGRGRGTRQVLISAPPVCLGAGDLGAGDRSFGLWANLYTVRGREDHGIGDFAALCDLIDEASAVGAAFVGINPLHATRNCPPDVSPYSGSSRIFRNPIYLDVTAVPEFAHCVQAQGLWRGLQQRRGALAAATQIDYPALQRLLRPVLRLLYRAMLRHPDSGRVRAFRRYCERDDGLAIDFATFQTIEDHQWRHGRARDWQRWPLELREPRSAGVKAFRAAHAREVEFHAFQQFEVERQLAAAAGRAGTLSIGLYQDLALGSAPSGFDAWAFRAAFLLPASLGAPADDYCPAGQEWGIPPLDPRRLADDGYRYQQLVLRAACEHTGALRLDHAIGLRRQFVVPSGMTPVDGAYLAMPERQLFALLALASHRHRCLVIGEDLGTVSATFAAALARAGILSSRVMLFERDRRGRFRPPARYSSRAMVTANTHDLVPLAGYVSGRDLELRQQMGVIGDDAGLAAERDVRSRDVSQLAARLRAEGLAANAPADYPAWREAVHRLLARTPCRLFGVSLDDLGGETEPVNFPGVSQQRHASWTRRMHLPLADIVSDPEVRQTLSRCRKDR